MKLSVIVPSLNGEVPGNLRKQVSGHLEVEIVSVVGVRPVGKARNEGLSRARGEYVAWVDADDEVSDDWLVEILKAIAPGPEVVVFDAAAEGWDGLDELVYGRGDTTRLVEDVYENKRLQGHLFRVVSRRSLWEGLDFDESIGALEDFLLLPEVLMRADGFVYVPKKLYRYVCTRGSASTAMDVHRLEESVRIAIRRWRETPGAYSQPSLAGSMGLVYDQLLMLQVDPRYREARSRASLQEGAQFLRRHLFEVKCGWRVRLRYICAALGFWWPQRRAYKRHFGRIGGRS